MRTAITLGIGLDGKPKLISGPAVPLGEQQAAFKKNRCASSSEEYAEILYVELDYAQRHKFRTPEAQAQHDKNMADNQKMYAEAQKPTSKSIVTSAKKPAPVTPEKPV